MSSYYKITLDASDHDAWSLALPWDERGEKVIAGAFTRGVRWEQGGCLHSRVSSLGRQTSMTLGLAGFFVREDVEAILKATIPATTFELIPVDIEGVPEKFSMLNVLDVVDCVDEARSEFEIWGEADGRPDRVGDYRMSRLVIDAARARGHELFRVKGWTVDLLCSDRMKSALLRNGVSGVTFRPIAS